MAFGKKLHKTLGPATKYKSKRWWERDLNAGHPHVNQTQWSLHRSASILLFSGIKHTFSHDSSHRCLLFQVIKIYKNPDENPLRAGGTTQRSLAGKRLRQSAAVGNRLAIEEENLKVGWHVVEVKKKSLLYHKPFSLRNPLLRARQLKYVGLSNNHWLIQIDACVERTGLNLLWS